MHPNAEILIEKMGLETPLIGFYDAPDTGPFEPLVEPTPGRRACVFAFYQAWLGGKTLHLTEASYGCGGAAHWLFCQTTRSRQDYLEFLVDEEGLKASHELMDRWLEHNQGYRPAHDHLLIGPLVEDQYDYLKTVTFYVNPDQLSLLITGAHYNRAPSDPAPVIAPFGSGCMELASLFDDLDAPQAMIGATDIAMRQYLAPDLLAFTVTKPMFEELCTLDEGSFLHKPFWTNLMKARRRLPKPQSSG